MKSKFLVSSLILSLMVNGCGMLEPKDKYNLKDTWGTDGNWGKVTKVAKETKKMPVKTVKPVTNKTPNDPVKKPVVYTEEVKHEEPTTKPVEEHHEPVAENTHTEEHHEPEDKMIASGPDGTFYVKEVNANFTVGAIKNLKATDLNPKFKEEYLKGLQKYFPKMELISTKDGEIKGKKAWILDYTFEKDSKKMQQMQVFIPQKNNTLIVNRVGLHEGFATNDKDFNDTLNNMVSKIKVN